MIKHVIIFEDNGTNTCWCLIGKDHTMENFLDHHTPRPTPAKYGWSDFEEDVSTDAIPDKFILTIGELDEDGYLDGEIAIIVHRTCNGKFPLDGPVAEAKREQARMIVSALNRS